MLQVPVHPFFPPVTFTRITHRQTSHGRSISPMRENAFSFQLPLLAAGLSDLQYTNGTFVSQEVKEPGRAFLFDLSAGQSVRLFG